MPRELAGQGQGADGTKPLKMNTPEEIYERIDAYLEGAMSDKDRAAFELQLQSDEELKSLVEEHQDILHGVRRVELFEKMKNWHSNLPPSEPQIAKTGIESSWKKWAIAASVLIVMGTLFLFIKIPGDKVDDPPIKEEMPDERPVASGRPQAIFQLPLTNTTDTVQLLLFNSKASKAGYIFDGDELKVYLNEKAEKWETNDFSIKKMEAQIYFSIKKIVYNIEITNTLTPLTQTTYDKINELCLKSFAFC